MDRPLVGSHAKLLLFICSAALTPSVRAALGPNLLLNPGFETGSVSFLTAGGNISGARPDSWFDNTDWAVPAPRLLYSLSTANARSTASPRNWCVRVTSNGFAQFGQFLNVKTASNYAVSGWFRVTAAASSTTMVNVRVGLQGAFFPFTLWGTTPQTALTTGSLWRQVTLTSLTELPVIPAGITAPSGNAAMLLYVEGINPTTATSTVTVCVDDAALNEIVCTGNPSTIPPNGTFSCTSGVSVGTVCTARCAAGFTGSPTPSSTCLPAGTWGPVTGACVRSNCTGNPTNPANGSFVCAPTPIGGRCNATCALGFFGNPTPSAACNTSAAWNPPTGTCSPIQCTTAPTTPANAVWSCPVSAPGSTCAGRCASGFQGSPLANCSTAGSWTVTGSCTVVQCTTAPTTPNAVWSCNVSAPGSTCAGRCASGFQGSPLATCSTAGNWTVTGSCTAVANCTVAPPDPTNGAFSCSLPARQGAQCIATCRLGYVGNPTPSTTCSEGGAWTTPTGMCVQVRCTSQPPPPLYGSFSCAVSTAVGGVCAGNCSSGYIGSPAPSAVCTATGAWSVQGQCINAAPQILFNPGFDQGSTPFSSAGGLISGSMPVSWTDNSDWATPTPSLTYSLSTTLPRTSSSGSSACVQVRSGFSQLVQAVNIKAATDYSMSAWFHVTSAAPVSVSLGLQANFAPFNWWGGTQATLTPGSGWSLLTVSRLDELPQPPSGTISSSVAALFILRVNTEGATVCMEDALLQEAGPGAPELLLNPGFDGGSDPRTSAGGSISGTWPTAWGDNTDWVIPTPTITADVISGPDARTNKALQLTVTSGFIQFVQFTTLNPGAAYRMGIWAKATPPTGLSGVTLTLQLRLSGEPYTSFAATTAVVGASWTQLIVPAVVVPAGVGPVGVGFFINTGGPGVVWLDDASLTAIPAAKPLPDQVLSPPGGKPIDRSFWCLNSQHMWPNDPYSARDPWIKGYLWPAVDFGIFRTWDSSIIWASVQPTDTASFNWTRMDRAASQARARGQRVLFTLGQTPVWASSNPTEGSVYGPGLGSPPANINHWKNFVTALERRYKGLIMGYEVWNEPNLQGTYGFYNGSPERLAALALATQEVLLAEGSTAWLINPPMAGTAADAINFLNRYYSECRRLGVTHQALAWHSYNMPAELDKESVDTLRSLMANQGLPADMPLLNTEAGILDGVFAALGNNHVLGAAFLAKTYAINWAMGVSSVCWYAYDAASMEGLTMSDYSTIQQALSLNPAGLAYNRVITWLQNATMVSMSRTQGAWLVGLSRPIPSNPATVSRSWLVWNGDARVAELRLAVPTAWGVMAVEDLMTGVRTALPAGQSIVLGEVPVLLRQT